MHSKDKSRLSYKEWIYKTLSHIETDKVPCYFNFTPPARLKLIDYFKNQYIENILVLPVRWGGPNSIEPL